MQYVSYMKTRHGSRTQCGPVRPDTRIAVKIVASLWENENGKW